MAFEPSDQPPNQDPVEAMTSSPNEADAQHLASTSFAHALEREVAQRTQAYLVTIQQLQTELTRRQAMETHLHQLQASLVQRVATQGRKINQLYATMLAGDDLADAGRVLTQALTAIAATMEADAACIYAREGDTLALLAHHQLPDAAQRTLHRLPGEWLDPAVPFTSADLPREARLPFPLRHAGFCACLAAAVNLPEARQGVLQVFWQAPQRVAVEEIASFTVFAEQVGIVLENARLRTHLEQQAIQLERRRLARDLHDSVTQSLHSLCLYVSALRHRLQIGQPAKIEETLDHLDETTRQALKEMRLLLFEMRLEPHAGTHLVEALHSRLEAVEKRAGIDAAVMVDEPAAWPPAWEAEMYPIAVEALNNALKYANAGCVRVSLRGGPAWVEMCVSDDGRGFDNAGPHPAGIGLASMRERAERLGGTLEIHTLPDAGTQVCLYVGTPAEARPQG